jgi:hypothetical protein
VVAPVATSYSVGAGQPIYGGRLRSGFAAGALLGGLVAGGAMAAVPSAFAAGATLGAVVAGGELVGQYVPAWRTSQTAQTWVEVPVVAALSTLSPHLDASINPNFPGNPEYMSAGAGSWATLCTAWNAGCYDKGRDEFLIPLTGGHADYAGNDYLALRLRLDSAQWVRRSNPTGWDGTVITNDQARLVSGSGTTVVLPSGTQAPLLHTGARDEASAVDDAYNGMTLSVFGQTNRTITDYVGSTRTATVDPAFAVDMANRLYSISNGPMVQGLLGERTGRYADGRARPPHTYNVPCFADLDDAPWMPVGGAGLSWTASQSTYEPLRVDRVTGAHTFYTAPSSTIAASPFGGATAYDPTRGAKGSFWYIGQGGGVIGRFDIDAGTWSQSLSFSVRGGEQCLTYLPDHDLLLVGSSAPQWAIYDPVANTLTNITTSGTPAGGNTSFGKCLPEYVAADGRVYWWNHGSDRALINYMTIPANPKVDTWAIAQTTPHGSNAVTPTAAASNGTYGRFRYSSFLDGFMLFNSVDGPLYFYARADL